MSEKILLIGLILLFSGCVEVVEVPTPIPTSNALTEISKLSMDYTLLCYDEDLDTINYSEYKLNDYVRGIVETTNVKKYDGYSVVEVLRVPEFWYANYFQSNVIYDSAEKCALNIVTIKYHITRIINGKTVVEKEDIFETYGSKHFICEKSDTHYEYLNTDIVGESMYVCLDKMLLDIVKYEQYYPEILDKYM